MQIFWLDNTIEKNAQYYSDRHVNKIILETAQCVCTALRKKGMEDDNLYRKTHKTHPVVEWIEESSANLSKAMKMAAALNKEYKYRDSDRDNHKSWMVLDQIDIDRATQLYEKHTSTLPPQTIRPSLVREDPSSMDEVVRAYREYYARDKLVWSDGKLAKWTKRGRPEWLTEMMKDPFTKTQIDYSGVNI